MKTNVRAFTDKELLDKVVSIGGVIPNKGKYHIIGVQSLENTTNKFDDKFYVYDGTEFIMVSSGTTNVGITVLKNFKQYNLPGAAVWKTDQFVEDCYIYGLHKSKMPALRANKPIYFYRDSDMDDIPEEHGTLYHENIYANMHGVDYNFFSEKIATNINGWSFGCQVWNVMSHYRNMVQAVKKRNLPVNYTLLKEWE